MPLRLPFRRPRRDECRRGLQHVCTRGTFVSQQKAFGLKTSERCLQYRPRTTSTEDSRILARTARHRTRASAHTAISPRGERGKIVPFASLPERGANQQSSTQGASVSRAEGPSISTQVQGGPSDRYQAKLRATLTIRFVRVEVVQQHEQPGATRWRSLSLVTSHAYIHETSKTPTHGIRHDRRVGWRRRRRPRGAASPRSAAPRL